MNNRTQPPSIFGIPDLLLKVGKNLPTKDLIHFSQSCGFFYDRLHENKLERLAETPRENLKKSYYNMNIISMEGKMEGMALSENLTVIYGQNRINVWDRKKNILLKDAALWKGSSDQYILQKVWVVDEKIICFKEHKTTYLNKKRNAIQIIDGYTGGLSAELEIPEEDRFLSSFTSVNGNEIITKRGTGEIACWDLSGQKIKSYQSYRPRSIDFLHMLQNSDSFRLLVSAQYIVDLRFQEIRIFNREHSQSFILEACESIDLATIKDNFLICGLSRGRASSPDIIVIDMTLGKITHTYTTRQKEHQQLNAIVVTDQFIVAAHQCGRIVAVDRDDAKQQALDWTPCPNLFLYDNYLFIITNKLFGSDLSIWDIGNREKIIKINNMIATDYEIKELRWLDNKLQWIAESVAKNKSSFVICDYKVLHQQQRCKVINIEDKDFKLNIDMDHIATKQSKSLIM